MKPKYSLVRVRASRRFFIPSILATALALALLTPRAQAADVFWDRGSATNAWATGGNWSPTNTAAAATGAIPAAADVAVFNISALNSAQTIDVGADRSITGLRFTTSGTVLIQAGGTNRILTLAGSGITKSGTGAITIGSATTNQNVALRLSANQTYENNNNTGAITIVNGVAPTTAADRTLTIGGSSTAANTISGVLGNNTAILSLTKSGDGLWILSGTNTYTGATSVTAGTLRANNNAAFGGTAGGVSITAGAVVDLNGRVIGAEAFTLNGTGISSGGALINSSATAASLSGTISVNSDSSVGGAGSGQMTLSGVISGAGALSKVGTGNVRLTGNSSAYAAGINVLEGTLEIGTNAAAAGTGTIQLGDTTGSANATLTGISSLTHANAITVRSGSSGTKTLALIAAPTTIFSGLITMNDHLTISNTGTGSLQTGVQNTAGDSINLNGNTLTIANTSTGRYFSDGVIYGAGNVVMNSLTTGDYVPRGDHTYSGGTTATAGLIAVDRDSIGTPGSPTSGAFGTGTLTLAGAQFRSGAGANRTVGNAVTISADTTFYTVSGEKTLTFSGPVTLSGGSRTLTANVGTTVAGTSTTFTGAIGDGGNALGLTKAGAGNLILGGANTYTGATTLNAGRLNLTGSLAPASAFSISPSVAGGAVLSMLSGAANPIASTSALTIDSTTGPVSMFLELGTNTAGSDSISTTAAATTTGTVSIAIHALAGFGTSATYDLITAASGVNTAAYELTSAPGGYTYTLTPSATTLQLGVTPTTAGDIFWRGNLSGSSSWSAISAFNTNWYTTVAGTTNAQANPGAGDTVNFSTVNATNTAGVITTTLDNNFTVNDLVFGSDPNGVTAVTIAGGTTPSSVPGVLSIAPASSADGINVGSNAGAVTISAPVVLAAAQRWTVDGTGANGSTLTVSGAISGSNPLDISGLVTLSAPAGSNTYSGATTVPNGSILVGSVANNLSANSAVTVNGTGILRLNGVNNTVPSLAGSGIVQNNHASTAATLTVGDATNTTFSGTLQNGAGGTLALTKTGAGILTLSGTNTHTGGTTISAGTLQQGVVNALPTGRALTVNGTGVFDLNGLDASVSTLGGVTTGIVSDNAAGAGISTLSITAAAAGSAVTITDGATRTVALRVTNENGSFLLNNAANTFSGGIVLTNSVTGTRMSPGTITAGAYGAGAITVGEAATDLAGIYFATGTQTLANPIISNTNIGTDRPGTFRIDGTSIVLSGQLTANLAPMTFSTNGTGAVSASGKITGPNGLMLLSNTLGGTALTATISNTANDYAGDTVINQNPQSGKTFTLAVGASEVIPHGAGKGNVIINSNGTGIGLLSLQAVSETINGLSGNGNVASTSGTVTLTLGDNNADGNHSGAINNTTGTLSVTKIGSGTQTLSGASNFGGALTVNGGMVAFPSASVSPTPGPLGFSSAVNLSGGGISYTASGAIPLGRPIAIGASAGTVDVASSSGSLTFDVSSSGGNLIKTGAGTAVISGSTTLNGGLAGVAVNAGTLRAGFGGSDVATVSVGATGSLNLVDASPTAETLTLDNSLGALTLANGAQLGFELVGAASDSIAVGATGTAVTAGVVTLNFSGTPTAGTYNLLTAPSGLSGATYALGTAPNGFNYVINASDTVVSVTVSANVPIYWRGGQDFSWNTLGSGPANWTTDSAGSVDASSKPVGADTVYFSATGAPFSSGTVIDTTLDAAFTLDSLQFTNVPATVTAVSIAAGTGGSLTLSPVSTSGGIRVLTNGGNATISAPLTIGAAQTWDVDPTGSLTISGDTVFNGNVLKSNTGALTLSGANSGTGTITLAGGTLNINSATALGSGTFAIGAGTTINTPAAAIALTNNNVQNWNGDFTFTGANNLNLGTGAVTLGTSLAVTTTANALTVGGVIGDGGNNRGLAKAGAGTLILNGANTFTGPVTITGGVLRITNSTGLGTVAGGVTQSQNTALEIDGTGGAVSVGDEAFTMDGGGGISNTGAIRNIAGDNTYGGTITLTRQSRINSDSGTLTLSNATAVTGAGQNLVVGGVGNLAISGAITTATGTILKDGTGTLTLSGNSTYTGNTTVTLGTLNVTGTGSLTGNSISTRLALQPTTSGQSAVVNYSSSGTSTFDNVVGANVAGTASVLNQSNGIIQITPNTTTDNQSVVGAAGAYGAYNISGGTFRDTTGVSGGSRFTVTNVGTASATNGSITGVRVGMVNVSGTGFIDHTNAEWWLNYSMGQINLTDSGKIDHTGSNNPFGVVMNTTVVGGGYGVINIAGAGAQLITGAQPLRYGNSTTAGAGDGMSAFVNLAAGTLSTGTVGTTSLPAAPTATNVIHYNYAGGTLKATAALASGWTPVSGASATVTNTIFGPIDNPGTANDFLGGLTVDTNGNAVTLPSTQVLLGASGVGVTQADLTISGGSGYISAPSVTFSRPSAATGVAASGYAVISGGEVTQIVITNPGVYASGEIPTIQLLGGFATGAGTAATVTSTALATPNTSGGLTKINPGTLTLNGANTYSGPTLVSGGTLQLNGAAATNPTTSAVTVSTGGAFGFTAATTDTLNLSTKDMTLSGGTLAFDVGDPGVSDTIAVNNFTITANSAFSFNSVGAVGGSYTLLTSVNPITNSGGFTISGQTLGRVTLTPTINANSITVGSTVFEGKWAATGGGDWSVGDPNATAGNWLNYKPTVAGDAALFGDTIIAASTVAVDTPHTVAYLRFDNTNAYTIGANGSSNLTLNNGASNAVTTVTSGSHTIAENVALLSNLDILPATSTTLTISGILSGAKNLEVNGLGTVVLSGANTYTGTTVVSQGRLNVTGNTTGTGNVTVGAVAGNAVLNVPTGGSLIGTASGTNPTITLGTGGAGSFGALNITGGTVTLQGAETTDGVAFGASNGGYGAFNMTGGSFTQQRFMFGGTGSTTGTGAVGVGIQTGGTVNSTGWMILSRVGASTGIYTITGGTLNHASANQDITIGLGGSGRAELNVAGGLINNTGRRVDFSGGTTGSFSWTGTGFLNLNAGTLLTNAIFYSSGTAYTNFNGGTLRAAAANTAFMNAIGTGAAYVNGAFGAFSGGAVIDNNGFDVTIAAALLAPTGDGVTTIPVSNGGSGYIGAPAVSITDGGAGFGATAIANMVDDLSGNGTLKIDSITITNPGNNYTAPSVTLLGGGSGVSAATLGTPTTAANTSGGLTKNSAGNLTLSGVNTYTGPTTINLGTLTINEGSIASSSNIVNNGALAYALSTNARTYSGPITGSGSVTKSGSNSLTLSGTNSYTGATTVNAGTLEISGSTNTTAGNVFVGAASSPATLNIAGTGSVTTTGNLNLGGAVGNIFTVQSGGSLNVTAINNGWGTSYTVDGTVTATGTWTVSTNRTTDTFNGTGTINAAALTLSNATTGINYTGSGTINIAGDVTVASNTAGGSPFYTQTSGTLNATSMLLGDATTGTRTFNLNGGRVNLGSGGIAATGAGASTRAVNLGAGTLGARADWSSSLAMTLTSASPGVTINTLDSVDNTTARTITLSGILSGATFALNKSGDGTLILTAANSYTGATTINAGTLQLGDAGTTGALSTSSAITNNGSLVINRTNAVLQNASFGAVSGTGTLTQAGTGTTTLNTANTYTGNTILSTGILNAGVAETAGTSGPFGNQLATAAGTILFNGGTLQYSAANTFDYSGRFSSAASQNYRVDTNAQNVTWASDLTSSNGTLTKSGTGTLTVSGNSSFSGGTTISGGVIQANHNNALGGGTVTINGGVRVAVNTGVDIPNAVVLGPNAGGTGRGLVESAGTSGTATVSGAITINNGASAGGHFNAAAGTVLHVKGVITSSVIDGGSGKTIFSHRAGDVMFSGGGTGYELLQNGQGNTIVGANNGIATTATVNLGASAAGNLDLNGFNQTLVGISRGANAGVVGNSSTTADSTLTTTGTSTFSGVIRDTLGSGTRMVALTVASGSLTLTGANIHTGGTTVNQGTLTVGTGGTLSGSTGALSVNNTNTGAGNDTVLNLATATDTTAGSLSGSIATPTSGVNTATINTQTGRTFTVNQTANGTYDGVIAGSGDFVLGASSTSTLTLSGTNTYTGTTTVSAGTLALVGGSQASPITVSAGASLGFTLGSPTTSTSTFNLTNGTIKITGTPTLPSYTLITDSTGITGTPVLDTPIAGYSLKKVGNTLILATPLGLYDAWANSTYAPPLTAKLKTDDQDGDGFINLMEYAFGTQPTVNSSAPLTYSGGTLTSTGQPVLVQEGGIWYAVFGRRKDYVEAGLTYTVEFSSSLAEWEDGVAVPEVIATDGTIDALRVAFPNFINGPSGPQKPTFFRVEVQSSF